MFDEHLNRQHRLTYYVRGPEWAHAIPHGDLAALEDVMRRCSTVWNGVGTVLVPVGANGRMPRWLDPLLKVRPVDMCFMHDRLNETSRAAVQKRIPGAVQLRDGFDEHEVPCLYLRPRPRTPEDPKPPLDLPKFRTAGLRRIALAIWGYIPDEELPYWSERYDVLECDGDAAHGALLRAQVEGQGDSPLRLSARHMDVVWQENPIDRPYLWVLGGADFNSLVSFWNFRARKPPYMHSAPVIGLPRESLRHPTQLGALADWLPRLTGIRQTPDVFVSCRQQLDGEVRAGLAAVPIVEETRAPNSEVGGDVTPNGPRTFSFASVMLGGRLIRGTPSTAWAAFNDGRSALVLPASSDFSVRTMRHTRLVLQNLPLPLPLTPSAARRVHVNAQANDGVLLLTNAAAEWNFDVRLPSAGQALEDWVRDCGFTLTRSQDGRDAEALLRRLGSLDELDRLADRKCLALLEALAPKSRPKLARRFIAEANRAGVRLNEAAMVEKLADIGLFLEVEARSANEIATTMGAGTRKRDVFELLPALVEAGFVRRAHEVRCPECRFLRLLDLSEQHEVVRCHACGERFVLPVVDESGQQEPQLRYRLDGLMARAMDQDVLPVLLTLRAVRPPADHPGLFFAWPGVVVAKDGAAPVDVDLLVSSGSVVWAFEVKQNATGLKAPQLRRLMEAAAALGARPGIAAVDGEFASELVERVLEASGRVLTPIQLIA